MSEEKEKPKESVMAQMKTAQVVIDIGNHLIAETQKKIAEDKKYKPYPNRAVK